ncbi:MAG: recombinase family protein [Clostridia bacterium]|nr:recombinase family protein [Clostridia bacterium]
MKRIYCLYRGIDGADIQRQQEECRKYADEHGWFIFKEFCEFLDNARDTTDALIDLDNAAHKNKFDILLVAEYENIGRIEQETPIAVFCLEKQGIEVVSVKSESKDFIEQGKDMYKNW